MAKKVYVVHCVDTEGPLYESIQATFERLKEIFGIELEPTIRNLKKLQRCEIELGGKESQVAEVVAANRINTLGTWDKIDETLNIILSDEFRNAFKDSRGKGWIYNWFAMDHVGFNGNNPRRRDVGFGNIYEHYRELIEENGDKDLIGFHYHPLPFNGHYNYCGTAYVNSNNIFQILCHRIIDFEMFPSVYRAGMEAERPDSHWFLEQWIPFDYSNDSFVKDNNCRQPDLRDGRYGDWRRAPMEWHPYHPSHDDYQLKGNCHRWITRCLNLDSRVTKLGIDDIRKAFSDSYEKDTILSFSNHDFRDMREEVLNTMKMLEEVSKEYPDVEYIYSNAIDAMRFAENLNSSYVEFDISIKELGKEGHIELVVTTKKPIFGRQPFFAVKTLSGQYYWDNFDFGIDPNCWIYVFDDKTISYDAVECVGIAANSDDGKTEIVKINFKTKNARFIYKEGQKTIKVINKPIGDYFNL